MKNLELTTQNNVCPTLTRDQAIIISAKNGQRIDSIDKKIVSEFFVTLILSTHLQCGQVSKDLEDSMELTIPELSKDVKNYFGMLTFQEIKLSFKMGVIGELGEWFGLNNKTYLQWISRYLVHPKRMEANKAQNSYVKQLSEPKQLTPAEKEKIIHDGCLQLFERYKTHGNVDDVGNVNYNYLESKGLIKFSKERKIGIYKLAKNDLIADKQRQFEETKIGYLRSQIKQAIADLEAPKSDLVVIAAKKLALNIFFADLIEMDFELKDQFT